jgi:hypothetical protein
LEISMVRRNKGDYICLVPPTVYFLLKFTPQSFLRYWALSQGHLVSHMKCQVPHFVVCASSTWGSYWKSQKSWAGAGKYSCAAEALRKTWHSPAKWLASQRNVAHVIQVVERWERAWVGR